jgi:hypothetical protein
VKKKDSKAKFAMSTDPSSSLGKVDDVTTRRPRVVSPEDLHPHEHQYVERLVKAVIPKGVLTGAILGLGDWDVRPLVLSQGAVYLIRSSDPELSQHTSAYRAFWGAVERARSADVPCSWGELPHPADSSLRQIWMKRPYYSTLLSEHSGLHGDERASFVGTLFTRLNLLQRYGVIHGHLSAKNIALEGDQVILLDHVFATYDLVARQVRNDLAPEIRRGELATAFSDVFGLALVLKQIYQDGIDVTEERRTAIEQGLLEDLHKRLSFERFQREFLGKFEATTQKASSTVGRVISQTSLQTANSVPTSKKSKTENNSTFSSSAKKLSESKLWGPIIGVVLVVALGAYVYWRPESPPLEEIPYELYWQSAEPDKLREVAVAAVQNNDEFAADIILSGVPNDTNSKFVNRKILDIGLDQRWRHQLSLSDKQTLLKVAVGTLLPRSSRPLSVTSETHPGVLFALLSQMNLDSTGDQLAHLKPEQLGELPGIMGPAFSLVGKLGATNLEDTALRGLAHILAGDTSRAAFEAFFPVKDQAEVTLAKLESLEPLIIGSEDFAAHVYTFLLTSQGIGSTLTQWFEQPSLVSWKGLPKLARMRIVLGNVSSMPDSFEELADLLTFPRTSVRDFAVTRLKGYEVYVPFEEMLKLLSSPSQNTLTRAQTISLLASFSAQAEVAHAFIAQWFSSKPAPQMVAQLLTLHTIRKKLDPFQVQAAQYLTENRTQIEFTEELLTKLSVHPESLARALAYLQLSIDNPKHRSILKKAVELEGNKRMKKDLQERLDSSSSS